MAHMHNVVLGKTWGFSSDVFSALHAMGAKVYRYMQWWSLVGLHAYAYGTCCTNLTQSPLPFTGGHELYRGIEQSSAWRGWKEYDLIKALSGRMKRPRREGQWDAA